MTRPFRDAEDHFDTTADALEEEFNATLVQSRASDVFADLQPGGPLRIMLDEAKAQVSNDINRLVTISAGDTAEILKIQAAMIAYRKLTEFAVGALRGNRDARADSVAEEIDDLLPGADEDPEDFIGRVGAGENAEG